MRTLLFSPMWIDEPWRLERHKKWMDHSTDLNFQQMLFVDNASKTELPHRALIDVHKCPRHLPRLSQNAYGYWYRAFRIAIEYAIRNKFEKLVHIDTDCYLLKPRICHYINDINSGWTTFWSETYGFPESSMQIICKDQMIAAFDFFTDGFLEYYPNDIAENKIPFTHVEKRFKGDRYGEKIIDNKRLEQTPEMDYYCQANPETKLIYNLS